MNIRKHIHTIKESQEAIDEHIWNVFEEYKKILNIHFSDPESWVIDGEDIIFYGSDGGRGNYDNVMHEIDLKYFLDTTELEKLVQKRKDRAKQTKIALEALMETKERSEFERLTKKYGEHNEIHCPTDI